VFHIVFFEPRIPQNTGNAIRTSAATGNMLHLVEPLGFEMSDTKLKRAGLDYHDLAHVMIHPDFDALMAYLESEGTGRIYAFTGHTDNRYTDVSYQPGDALMFGPEPTGLPDEIMADPRITRLLRIPMQPGIRSLNLSNSAAIATFEAWRQNGFAGGV